MGPIDLAFVVLLSSFAQSILTPRGIDAQRRLEGAQLKQWAAFLFYGGFTVGNFLLVVFLVVTSVYTPGKASPVPVLLKTFGFVFLWCLPVVVVTVRSLWRTRR